MDGVNWDMVQVDVTAIGSMFLAWASLAIWRIHKTNQRIQQHDIGNLTEKEMYLLWDRHGEVWSVIGGEYVRGMLFPERNNYDIEVRFYPFVETEKEIKIWDGRVYVPDVNHPVYPYAHPVKQYIGAMRMLLLYGLMEKQYVVRPPMSKESLYYPQSGFVYRRTEYGELEYERQLSWTRRWSRLKRLLRAVLGPVWRWTE